ncbi:hypothetical protein E2C01_074534 [Portunus trituberculatus]|uniref:Uncharacterized protein n=1 Tax=Portunus trituberculatus TaxID=210409 RepID=A0A5B7IHH4_PORTR|nr:hypothetical protein [Portunus trituberculatus]
MAVEAMFPGERRQQPATPVQKATKTKKNDTMKRAIMERAISVEERYEVRLTYKRELWVRVKCVAVWVERK